MLLEINIHCKLTDTCVSNTILDMAPMEKKKSQRQMVLPQIKNFCPVKKLSMKKKKKRATY